MPEFPDGVRSHCYRLGVKQASTEGRVVDGVDYPLQRAVLSWHRAMRSGQSEGTSLRSWTSAVAHQLEITAEYLTGLCNGRKKLSQKQIEYLLYTLKPFGREWGEAERGQVLWELKLAAGQVPDPKLYVENLDRERVSLAFNSELRELLPEGCLPAEIANQQRTSEPQSSRFGAPVLEPAPASDPAPAPTPDHVPPPDRRMVKDPPIQQDEFFKELARTLCERSAAKPLTGEWAKQVVAALSSQCNAGLIYSGENTAPAIINFIATVEGGALLDVLASLRLAYDDDAERRLVQILDDEARHWYVELTCLTVIRGLDLRGFSIWRPENNLERFALTAELATDHPLLAAAVLSQKLGLRLVSPRPGESPALLDMTEYVQHQSDAVAAVVCAVYDLLQIEADLKRRDDPSAPLTDEQSRALRVWMRDQHRRRRLKGVFIKFSDQLPLETQLRALADVAHSLSAPVVKGEQCRSSELVAFQIRPGDLVGELEEIWRQLLKLPLRATSPFRAGVSRAPEPVEPRLERFDFFLCHATADKERYIQPLYDALKREGATIWFDKNAVSGGDSLLRGIGTGLNQSRLCAVCISRAFMEWAPWANEELFAVHAQQISTGTKRVVPVLLDVDLQVAMKRYSMLGDKLTLTLGKGGFEQLAAELIESLKGVKGSG